MKEFRAFILSDVIILIIKILGGILCKSYTFLMSGFIDIYLIMMTLLLSGKKDNSKGKGFITSIFGFVLILLSLLCLYMISIRSVTKPSLFIILFLLLMIIVKYVVGCFYTNANYTKRIGLVGFSNIYSTVQFLVYGIVLGSLILCKIGKWVELLRYGDIFGSILMVLIVIYFGSKLIFKSFKYLEDNLEDINDDFYEEINKSKEVKKIDEFKVSSYGGFRKGSLYVRFTEGISLVDINTFIITLQDFILKKCDVAVIYMMNAKLNEKVKKPRVRSKKQDARNSGSRNSKTNVKRKNSTKKNKKR